MGVLKKVWNTMDLCRDQENLLSLSSFSICVIKANTSVWYFLVLGLLACVSTTSVSWAGLPGKWTQREFVSGMFTGHCPWNDQLWKGDKGIEQWR